MRVAFSCCKVRVGLCFSLEVQPLLFFIFCQEQAHLQASWQRHYDSVR